MTFRLGLRSITTNNVMERLTFPSNLYYEHVPTEINNIIQWFAITNSLHFKGS